MHKNICVYLADLRIDFHTVLCYYNTNRWICFIIEGLLINRFGNVEEQSDEVITAAPK